jgi:hypothetical protein
MGALKVSHLAKNLRALADSVEQRLWIVSPYIGSWRAVRRILGSAWERVDVRLLTDKDSGILAQDTIERFAAHRPIKSLKGVHAKLYIMDDSVLLTSANLTEAAFTRRHEAGLVLKGEQARELVDFYESLWARAEEVQVDSISFTKCRKGSVDEAHGHGALPQLHSLPPAPEASPKGAGEFADYPYFLEIYRDFAGDYLRCGGRDHPDHPLFLETDKFLNFLFHDDINTPSKAYKNKPPRNLSKSERLQEIRKYRARYREAGLKTDLHLKTAKLVQRFLAKSRIGQLTSEEIETTAGRLNCFGVNALAKAKFVNNNDRNTVRKAWFNLIHGSGELKLRMNQCRTDLFGFGKSAIQETLGYYDPEKYPLRNENTNAGLRFLGYNV